MNGFSDKEIIAALVTVLVASYAAFFAWVVASIHRLDWKIDGLGEKLGGKIESLTVAVARLEGSLWGRTPPEPARKAEGG
jgi:hypothetical protein